MKRLILLLVLIPTLVLADYDIKILSVYDGDTITADVNVGFDIILTKQKIRLLYINAPEIRGASKEEGKKARAHLLTLLKLDTGKHQLRLDPKEKHRDSFGRILGVIIVDGEAINLKMVEDGHAERFK